MFDSSKVHTDFAPLLAWLYDNPKTSLVIGGKTYRKEVGRLHKYIGNLVELKRARKLSEITDDMVDKDERRLKKKLKHRNFDDAHILALVCASGCMLFASHDKRADQFLKMKSFYLKGQKRPLIYRYAHHKKHLQNKNIIVLRNVLNK